MKPLALSSVLGAVAAFSLVLSSAPLFACNVPVFRFALEHWRPDPYRITIYHRDPLTEAQQAQVAALEAAAEKQSANAALRVVEVTDDSEGTSEALQDALPAEKLPAVVVQYPSASGIEAPILVEKLAGDALAGAFASATRSELIERLVAGQTAVWLLLECGDKARDDEAETMVQEQLVRLKANLELPELSDAPEDKLLTTTPLEIRFSILRLPRAAAEDFLLQSLLRSEADLAERDDPMVFPIFGRGRALLPLIGKGITPGNIRGAAEFLTGACSCEVKALNPGFDLLLAADWDALLSLPEESSTPADSTDPQVAEYVPIPTGKPVAVAAVSNAAPVAAPAAQGGSRLTLLGAFGGAILIAVALAAVLSWERPANEAVAANPNRRR